MAGIPSITGLSGLNEKDAYYQYLINNNSTSTMLNALSGQDSDKSEYGSNSLSGLVNSVSSLYSASGLGSIGSLTGTASTGDIGSVGQTTGFYQILQSYMNTEKSEAQQMAQKMADVLEQAEDTGSATYKTVQELYQYFVDKSSNPLLAGNTSTSSTADKDSSKTSQAAGTTNSSAINMAAPTAAAQETEMSEFDFDGFESNVDKTFASFGVEM